VEIILKGKICGYDNLAQQARVKFVSLFSSHPLWVC